MRSVVSIIAAIIIGSIVLFGNKTVFALVGIVLLISISLIMIYRMGDRNASRYFLYMIILSIPFPILIQYGGKDALTVTTILIFLLLGKMIFDKLVISKKTSFKINLLSLIPTLILLSLTFTLILNPRYFGQSFRYYMANLSGIGIYFLVLLIMDKPKFVVNIFKIILIGIFIQFIVSFLQLKYPDIARIILIPFGNRVKTGDVPEVEGILRANGALGDYELLAQMFLLGSILSLCLVYILDNFLYVFPFLFSFVGILFTKTRSVLILLIFSLFVIYILLKIYKNEGNYTFPKILLILILGIAIIFVIFPSQISDVESRLTQYIEFESLLAADAMNREKVWDTATFLLKNPKIFGNGLHEVSTQYSWGKSFHSLYFTIYYKMGIMGLFLYIFFWITLLLKSLRVFSNSANSNNWFLVFFLFISVVLLLIDGIKVEFLRTSQTIQFAWLIFALLAVSLNSNKDFHENTMVSSSTI